jgi:2-dehydro-3-deoxygluconokinase
MGHKLSVACFGEVMIELMIDDLPGDTKANIAGDTFNTAVYLRRVLDDAHSVDYVTALGEDRLSSKIMDAIKDHGDRKHPPRGGQNAWRLFHHSGCPRRTQL